MKISVDSLVLLSGLLVVNAQAQKQVTGLPTEAKCWNIPYNARSIAATASSAYNLPLSTIHEFPMAYPLSNMIYPQWEQHGAHFPLPARRVGGAEGGVGWGEVEE
ncbi:hypothetical protein G7Y79_00067g095450 [Physcia stellaris]|nr:hypothetical protein G7Y79_00067g095450 [Physcia stellaris]